MQEYFIFGASVFCLVVGLVFCWPPIERYRGARTVGGFGALLVICGVVLMTTFKWTEVAIKVSDFEVRLAEAEQRANQAELALQSRTLEIDKVLKAASTAGQEQTFDVFVTTLSADGKQPVSAESAEIVKKALEDAGLTIIPTDSIPDYKTAEERPLNPSQGG